VATVLVVDDRPVNRDLVRTLLSHRGHRVLEASDGSEALSLARLDPPDLVITDVLMPGMDGCELIREMRAAPDTASVPVVFYTANYLEDELRPIADAYGVSAVLTKSSDPEVLLRTIDEVLADQPPPVGLPPDDRAMRQHLRTVNAKLVDKVRELEAKDEALLETEARFRRMAESSPVGILLGDPRARAVYVNPRFVEIAGGSAEGLLGEGWSRRLGLGADDVDKAVQAAAAQPGMPVRHQLLRPDGGELGVNLSLSVVLDVNGQPSATIGTLEDVTATVEAGAPQSEARQQASQRLEGLGRLAGGVAHDFNNLLTVILAHTRLAQETGNAMLEHLDQVLQAGNRSANLVAQLLAFGQRNATPPAVIDLNTVVREVLSLLDRTLGDQIEIRSNLSSDLWRVNADPTKLSQIILNLAVNARDAMTSGGLLTVQTENYDTDVLPPHPAPDQPPGKHVLLTVSDTGHGMPPEVLDRALDTFFTTKRPGEGTGLGLATVRDIVTHAGGRIAIHSTVDEGTSIEIFLPAVAGQIQEPAQATQDIDAPGGTETVLVVDDQSAICDIIDRILSRAGYHVVTATSSRDALDIVANRQLHVDLLLTDVVMPQMLGSELSQRITALQPHTRVLYTSGYGDALFDEHRTLEPGTTMLSKPFSAASLLRAVRAVLDPAPTR
jgi:PAS domain S-box-containing protein